MKQVGRDPRGIGLGEQVKGMFETFLDRTARWAEGPSGGGDLEDYTVERVAQGVGAVIVSNEGPRFVASDFRETTPQEVIEELDLYMTPRPRS